MYLTSVPISAPILTEENRELYHRAFVAGKIGRVFLCCLNPLYQKNCLIYTQPKKLESHIRYFKSLGYEVGVWVDGFGHGHALSHDIAADNTMLGDFTYMTDDRGEQVMALCPFDKGLIACFSDALRRLSAMGPDLIMFDDDYRINVRRGMNLACCCDAHMAEFECRIGEKVAREDLEKLLFTGGKNRYRDAWMEMMGDTIRNFSKKMREAVDSVNPRIRMSICACYDTWDFDGTDCTEIARILAGNTKPFLRTIGAPYHRENITTAVESTRMQAKWCRDTGVEVFAEGDVYPRPRYNVPSRRLELYDAALLATGELDGGLKYMFDYNQPIEYEVGYINRHVKNLSVRESLGEIFANKHAVGVSIFEAMKKIGDWDISSYVPGIATHLSKATLNGRAQKLLAENAIPTAYEPVKGYPVAVFGENARHIDPGALQNGAILDATAARILCERGIDTGLIDAQSTLPTGEQFNEGVLINGLKNSAFQMLTCAEGAKVLSHFLPTNTPASYLYENSAHIRFFVLGIDAYAANQTNDCANYFNNYYRNLQLPKIIEWLASAPLPATCTGHPMLQMIVGESDDKNAISVLLINPFADEIFTPTVTLAKCYRSIRFVNGEGKLDGNTVTFSTDISPFGFAAFEVCQ